MNGLRADGLALAAELAKRAAGAKLACELLVCPPATLLTLVAEVLQGSGIALGGQDCHAAPKGAFSLTVLFDRAAEKGRLFGLRLEGVWMHVGTPEAVAAAEAALAAT